MMTVRFPNGFSVQYNTASFISWGNGSVPHYLYTKKGGVLLACVPFDCIVEWVQPCKMYFAGNQELEAVWKENKRLNRRIARLLKKAK